MPEQIWESGQEQAVNRRLQLANYALNLTLVASLCLVGSFYEGDDIHDTECTSVTATELAQTERLLEAPGHFDALAKTAAHKADRHNKVSGMLALKAARKNGLRLVDVTPYVQPLEADAKEGYTKPFSSYLDAAQEYYANYGITVSDRNSTFLMGSNETKQLSTKQLETETAKQDVIDLLEATNVMPQEYLQLADLKSVIFNHDARASARWNVTNGKYGTFSVDLADRGSAAVNHETFHGVAEKLCTDNHYGVSLVGDPEIAHNNTSGYTYASDSTHLTEPTAQDFEAVERALTSQVDHHQLTKAAANKRLAAYGEKVSFTDPYAGTNPAEDAAQIGRYFGVAWAKDIVLNPYMPHLRDKAIVWLTRMRLKAPRLFSYINDTMASIDPKR